MSTAPTSTKPTAKPAAKPAVESIAGEMISTTSIGCAIVLGLIVLIYYLNKSGASSRNIAPMLQRYGASMARFRR